MCIITGTYFAHILVHILVPGPWDMTIISVDGAADVQAALSRAVNLLAIDPARHTTPSCP